jgi:glutamyl-tRNA synthetase/glutamyl-Q tRNA(Asp) synthetase
VAAMIYVWGLAARHDAVVDVRIEDHDRERCRPEFTAQLRETLDWLGFAPFLGGVWSVQSEHEERFQSALEDLRSRSLVYACRCSRKDLVSTGDLSAERLYPGNCRDLNLPEEADTVLRVRLPENPIRFYDSRHGWQAHCPATQCGDFVIRDRLKQWTYQFAVVVDDLFDDINWIIRGDDLLASTGRQLLLAGLLGRKTPLSFLHHPLIVNSDGSKLSKRDNAAPLEELRRQGLSAAEIIGLAAHRCGLASTPVSLPVNDLRDLFGSWTTERVFAHPFEFC